MTQYSWHQIVPTTDTGTTLSTALNSLVPSLYSTHSGNTRPSYVVANMLWIDTTDANDHKIYVFDGTQDQLIASFNPTVNNSVAVNASGKGISFSSSTTGNIGEKIVDQVTFANGDVVNAPNLNRNINVPNGVWHVETFIRLVIENSGFAGIASLNITPIAGNFDFVVGKNIPMGVADNAVFLTKSTSGIVASTGKNYTLHMTLGSDFTFGGGTHFIKTTMVRIA